jgi:hypothetical protein
MQQFERSSDRSIRLNSVVLEAPDRSSRLITGIGNCEQIRVLKGRELASREATNGPVDACSFAMNIKKVEGGFKP